jgi:hypothetical protein
MLVPMGSSAVSFFEAADRGAFWRHRTKEAIGHPVIPGREHSKRTRNLEIPGSMLRIAPD